MRRIIRHFVLLVAILVASGPVLARSMERYSDTSTSAVFYLASGRDQRNVVYEAFLDPLCGFCQASATPIENAAEDYVRKGKPVLFLEYAFEEWPFSNTPRQNLWYQSYKYWTGGSTSYLKPPAMTDSGEYTSDGPLTSDAITTMVDRSLNRVPQADILAAVQRVGDHYHFDVEVTNLSGGTLSSANEATVWAIVYEDVNPILSPGLTSRYVRAVASTPISSLANGATESYSLDTADLTGVDWYELHPILIVDYRTGSGYYDMLQAAFEWSPAIFKLSKFADPATATVGDQITYTIQVQNMSDLNSSFSLKDNLPPQVTYSGETEWSWSLPAWQFPPGAIWETTFVVTVTDSFAPVLSNQAMLTPTGGTAIMTSVTVNSPTAQQIFLPLVICNYPAIPGTPWQTMFKEGFEGSFPGSWTITDPGSSGYQWAQRDCRAFEGMYSGWAIGGGTSGSGLPCGDYTANHNLRTQMTYGPLDLSDATEAELSFMYWFNTDVTDDYWSQIQFCAGAETSSSSLFDPLTCIYGDSGGWREATFDLSLFDVLGESSVYVQIDFTQWYSSLTLEDGGVFIDNIVVRKR